jgi:hypothetical protein
MPLPWANKSDARVVVRTQWRGPEMRQDGFLESGTLGKVLKCPWRLVRPSLRGGS